MDERLAYAIKFTNLTKTINAYIQESYNLMKQECLTTINGVKVSATPENINLLDLLIRANRPAYIYNNDGDIVDLPNPTETLGHLLDVWGRASNRHNHRILTFKNSRSITDVVDMKLSD